MTQPRLVGGRYEIGELLGYGGMAEVHKARDLRLGRDVAVKVLRSDLARDPSFQNRFRREAQAAAGLNHPSIVGVYDTGEDGDPAGVDDAVSPYIVMEFVEGRTLREVLKSEGPLPPRRAMEIVAEICAALDFSHRSGIVHRDVKPGNVMITDTGAVKVMDFGIARALADNAATVTATSAVIGTAQYLSPEQARGESVDARSDVYSTGCLLYELLVGHPPFTGDSPVAVAYQHVRENPRIPSSENPAIPPALDSIVMKSLAKNPLNRYQTAGEMRADLQRAIAGNQVEAESIMTEEERTQFIAAAPPPTGRPGVLTPVSGDDDDQHGHRGAVIWTAVVLALLLVIGVSAFFLLRSNNKASPPPMAIVPPLANLSVASANAALKNAGLPVPTGTPEGSSGPCSSGGTASPVSTMTLKSVCTQSVPAGQSVVLTTVVTYTIYTGPATVTVPQVTNGTCAQAQAALNKLQLKVLCNSVDSNQPAGTVLTQNPVAFGSAKPGDTVTLTVSNGKSEIPDVTGKTYEQARILLQQAGWLNVESANAIVQSPYKVGQVMSQDPAAGSSAVQNTTITLTVAIPKPLPSCSTPSPTPSDTPSGSSSSSPGASTSSSASASASTSTSASASTSCTPAG
jgi:serine/threonine protein kinase